MHICVHADYTVNLGYTCICMALHLCAHAQSGDAGIVCVPASAPRLIDLQTHLVADLLAKYLTHTWSPVSMVVGNSFSHREGINDPQGFFLSLYTTFAISL